MNIRPALESDSDQLKELFFGLTQYNSKHMSVEENWETLRLEEMREALRQGKNGEAIIYVADEDGILLGHVYAYVDSLTHAVTVEKLFVLPEGRGKGVGTALMHEAERWAKERHFNVRLEVYPWNKDAIRFYEALGYTQDSLVYTKDISS